MRRKYTIPGERLKLSRRPKTEQEKKNIQEALLKYWALEREAEQKSLEEFVEVEGESK